ncbi:MAG: OmpA family protein [Labilithrix sp.]|nr:OmpA family protein [Labilithrix sp.]MCW5811806.1 OmpA family protein [Labilithrix sp.]
MRAQPFVSWFVVLLAACGAQEGAGSKHPGGDDSTSGGGKVECTDVDATSTRDASYRIIDTTDPARRPALPPRVVADKLAFAVNDHDGDGIDDEYDLCPASAEDGREPHPFDGCAADADHTRKRAVWPDLPRVVVKGDRIDISEQIHFAPASAKILEDSKSLVAAIAQAILDNPEIELVEVAGHADKQGDAKTNLTLTHQRAKAVVDALVARGVSAKWLRSMGYGEYCPLDTGVSKEAFAKNRRVEFRIIRRDGKELTPSWGGCDAAEKQGVRRPGAPPAVTRPKASKPAASKGAPTFHGSCRTRYAAECEADCRAGSTVSCYVGAHEQSHASEPAALTADRSSLKRECDAGLFPACSQLAMSLFSSPPHDHATALALATPACEKGDGVGCGAASFLLQRGCNVPADPTKAYALAKKGCAIDVEHARERMPTSVGDRLSCGVASSSLWSGLGGPRDRAAAYALDQRACAAGLPRACVRLAEDALSEPSLVTDRDKLVATLHDACEQAGWEDQASECIALAHVEKPGEYQSPRLCEAGGQLECAKKCAESDWEPCMDLYISALYRGFHRRVDSLSPRGWTLRGLLEEAKTDRYRDSQAKLDEAAADHYSKACTANVPSGCIHHARMRLEGRGVFRDPSGAARALDEWCAKGEKMACAFLAHAAATKKIPGGQPEAQRRLSEACKAGLKRACK